jgi:hypothetical protein
MGGVVASYTYDLFERRFSADSVKRHKPAPETCAYVDESLGWSLALWRPAGKRR